MVVEGLEVADSCPTPPVPGVDPFLWRRGRLSAERKRRWEPVGKRQPKTKKEQHCTIVMPPALTRCHAANMDHRSNSHAWFHGC